MDKENVPVIARYVRRMKFAAKGVVRIMEQTIQIVENAASRVRPAPDVIMEHVIAQPGKRSVVMPAAIPLRTVAIAEFAATCVQVVQPA